MPERLPKWVSYYVVPVFLVLLGLGLSIYMVNNPGGTMEERLLNYPFLRFSLRRHLELVFISCALAIAVGVPIGIMLTRPHLYLAGKIVENVVNVGQTVPSLAILALFYAYLGGGFQTALFALWLYSILPVLRNTFAGIMSIEPGIIDSARGMGMSSFRILTLIELPLAYPVIMAGIRTAVVINVGTATLATFVGAGGFGDLIVTGISVRRDALILTGAILSALLAILLDHLLGIVEERLISREQAF